VAEENLRPGTEEAGAENGGPRTDLPRKPDSKNANRKKTANGSEEPKRALFVPKEPHELRLNPQPQRRFAQVGLIPVNGR
jgi:hypothetical protein